MMSRAFEKNMANMFPRSDTTQKLKPSTSWIINDANQFSRVCRGKARLMRGEVPDPGRREYLFCWVMRRMFRID